MKKGRALGNRKESCVTQVREVLVNGGTGYIGGRLVPAFRPFRYGPAVAEKLSTFAVVVGFPIALFTNTPA